MAVIVNAICLVVFDASKAQKSRLTKGGPAHREWTVWREEVEPRDPRWSEARAPFPSTLVGFIGKQMLGYRRRSRSQQSYKDL